jgi:hypothetical protein
MVGMSERASRVDGRLTVLARPGHGTTVRVTAPLGGGATPPLAESIATTS